MKKATLLRTMKVRITINFVEKSLPCRVHVGVVNYAEIFESRES